MEGKIHFDALKYPGNEELMNAILRRLRLLNILLGLLAIMITILIVTVFITRDLPLTFPLLISLCMFVPWVLVSSWLPRKVKRDFQEKPLRITDEGIVFRSMKWNFGTFDRIVRSEEVMKSIKPGIAISFVKGNKRVGIPLGIHGIGDLKEFLRVIVQLHPEIIIDIREEKK